jgi:hypothetical protein
MLYIYMSVRLPGCICNKKYNDDMNERKQRAREKSKQYYLLKKRNKKPHPGDVVMSPLEWVAYISNRPVEAIIC